MAQQPVAYPAEVSERAETFLGNISEKNVCVQQISRDAPSVYLMSGSILTIEATDYILYTEMNLDTLYTNRTEQMRMICYINLLTAAIIAVLLLLTTYFYLRPLSAINEGLEQITSGDYSTRLKVQGTVELRQLIAHINNMAQATEEHVEQLQHTAVLANSLWTTLPMNSKRRYFHNGIRDLCVSHGRWRRS